MMDSKEREIYDLYLNRYWALKFATTAANTVLLVDQVRPLLFTCTISNDINRNLGNFANNVT